MVLLEHLPQNNEIEIQGSNNVTVTANNCNNVQSIEPSTVLQPGQRLAIRTRSTDAYYPSTISGYITPPPILESSITIPQVVYQDDEIAIINKPENLTTIGGGEVARHDLQSVLPFILTPPPSRMVLPRPVHRLDRRTSGLVLVAKTKKARQKFSQAFEHRRVDKTYTAIVFGIPTVAADNSSSSSGEWNTIDYPIDGKQAISAWRIIETTTTTNDNDNAHHTLSMLQIKPQTGRYHQIRRHLAYCLGTPIVGDAKYDGGSVGGAKSLRYDGMFLCSNALEIPHDPLQSLLDDNNQAVHVCMTADNGVFRIEIPLPTKFDKMMKSGLSQRL